MPILRHSTGVATLAVFAWLVVTLQVAGAQHKKVVWVTPQTKACDVAGFARLKLSGARIVSVAAVPAGVFNPQGSPLPLADLPDFCRVQAIATPTSDSLINFELWIPGARWNGKLVTTGNGGYSPALNYRDMAYALRQGYAAIGGDTGHQTEDPNDLSFVVGHPEKMTDWGSRSIHAITVAGKRMLAAFKGRSARRAYYYGCSTGGHQGFAEMQQHPADFDGVIAGAPAYNRVRLNAAFVWQFLANHNAGDNTKPIIPASKLALITKAVLAACDASDGVADGVVDDPRSCRFDASTLRCKGGDSPDCLTAQQLGALEKMYAGTKNPRTGEQVYPGWPRSSEALTGASGWSQYWGTTEPARVDFWRLWVFEDPKWDWWKFDFDHDLARADAKVGRIVDKRSPDLRAFKARGGKAIVYHGWQDPVVNPLDTIAYYEEVRSRQASQSETDKFFRLYLVPGMGHCAGGTGATNFGNAGLAPPSIDAAHDCLSALDRWVEQGVAPDAIVASRIVDGRAIRTRPLCPYPKKAVYKGTGSTDDAGNFSCR